MEKAKIIGIDVIRKTASGFYTAGGKRIIIPPIWIVWGNAGFHRRICICTVKDDGSNSKIPLRKRSRTVKEFFSGIIGKKVSYRFHYHENEPAEGSYKYYEGCFLGTNERSLPKRFRLDSFSEIRNWLEGNPSEKLLFG